MKYTSSMPFLFRIAAGKIDSRRFCLHPPMGRQSSDDSALKLASRAAGNYNLYVENTRKADSP